LAASCAHETVNRRDYAGEVIGVQSVQGEHFSLTKGPVPLTFLFLRIDDEPRAYRFVRIRIALTEIYHADVHGRVGDRVAFRYDERLPFEGEIAFREVDKYRIIKKSRSTLSSPSSGL